MAFYENENDDDFLEEDSQKDKYITFKISSEEYAIGIAFVNEIIGIQDVTHLPDMPEFIKGVINLRGNVIPIVDLRKRFKMIEIEYSTRACIIVVYFNEIKIGLVVDEVSEVLNIPSENVESTPKSAKILTNRFIKGIGKVNDLVKIILDIEKILTEDEIEKIRL
jgi:purine-binding chemotaxis protein CheW